MCLAIHLSGLADSVIVQHKLLISDEQACFFYIFFFSYSLQPFEHPYCTEGGVIFDLM